MAESLERLDGLRSAPVPPDLTAWAETLAAVDADERAGSSPGLDLLGLRRRAGVFPALRWNGARIRRAVTATPASERVLDDTALLDGLTLLATVCGADRGSSMLATAVEAGIREAERADLIVHSVPGSAPMAGVTRWVPAAAVCALVAAGGPTAQSSPAARSLIDLAGALLVAHPPNPLPADEAPLLGHTLAAGWLANRLQTAGVVGCTDTFERTVAAVVGAS
ncbi:MAG: hypothetical protein ABIQ53_11705 [Terracoccus sp.]